MKKVYNLKLEIDSPEYVLTDEQFCEGLKEVIADEMDDEIKYVKMTAECVDKDHELAVMKKALELACEHMTKFVIPCPNKKCGIECHQDKKECYVNYFINQAKEKLEKK